MFKKILFSIVISCISFSGVFAEAEIPVERMNSLETSCNGANVNENIYIPEDSFYLKDNYLNSSSDLDQILFSDSKVSYYLPEDNMITFSSGGNIGTNFYRVSWVAPKNIPVRAVSSNYSVTLNRPTNINNNKIQFVYKIAYKEQTGFQSGTSPYSYFRVGNMNDFSSATTETFLADNRKRLWSGVKYHANECYTITLSWCGDGKYDSGNEQCDPNDFTQTGWGIGGCSATCQDITTVAPTCGSLGISPSTGSGGTRFVFTGTGNNLPTGFTSRIDITGSGFSYTNTINSYTGTITGLSQTGTYISRLYFFTGGTNQINGSGIGSCRATFTVESLNDTTPSCGNLVVTPRTGSGGTRFVFTGTGNNLPTGFTSRIDVTGSGFTYNRVFNSYTGSLDSLTQTGIYTTALSYFTSTGAQISGSATGSCLQEFLVSISPFNNNPNPECGTAARRFGSNDTSYGSFTFCNDGATPNPNPPPFPARRGSVSWTCNDVDGDSVTCTASRGGGTSSRSCSDYQGTIRGSLSNPISSTTLGLCGPGYAMTGFQATSTSSDTTRYSWSCNGESGCNATYTDDDNNNDPSNRCGDGDIGNYATTGEECDFGSAITRPAWCSQLTCKIIPITEPGAYNLRFEPSGEVLLGDRMSIFGNLSTSYVKVTNNSASDVYLPYKACVYKTGAIVINGADYCTSNEIGTVTKNTTKTIGIALNNHFEATTDHLSPYARFGDAQLMTTLEGYKNLDTFLKTSLKVRVAKSSVTTLGGGASVLNGTKYSDVNTLAADGFSLLRPEYNKNLILTSLGINPLSSYVKSTNEATILTASKAEGDKEMAGFDKIENTGLSNTITKLSTEKFNGLENVFTHKGNMTLSAQSISGGNKTYIIDGGNLTLNGNITSTDNILFVVKNGNIIIKNNVTKLDAIFINIGGDILGETQGTLNRLVVNGALYGDVSDLLSKRTYIKDRGAYVDVGTNINFTSKIFDSPPPLLSKFLGEYTEISKIPK